MRAGWRLLRILGAGAGILVGIAGCTSKEVPQDIPDVEGSSTPVMPMPMPGSASLAGRVLDADGNPVAAAAVVVAETDDTATTDTTGAYQLMVPSDSTVTVVTTAAGFAKSHRESVVIANQVMVTGFDVLLLPLDTVARLNGLAGEGAASRGLMAVRLHSMNDACLTSGAQLSVWPPKAATIIYSRPSGSTGLDEPDVGMDRVQAGARIDAWLAGALSPGAQLQITVDKAGCRLQSPSPAMNGVLFPGLRPIGAQALTEVDLFLNN